MVGYSFAFVADFNKAMIAAARVFQLLDRKPLIDTNPAVGLKLNEVEGNLSVKDAEFSYPTRPNINKERGKYCPGWRVWMWQVHSNSGKNRACSFSYNLTFLFQLIQRLYDLEHGSIDLESHNIESLNLPFVRSKLGIVSQEPVLFDRTIAENIQYGDNQRIVTMEEVSLQILR